MRYALTVDYDGSNYFGWQKQSSTGNTVQQVLEDTLSRFIDIKGGIVGCGRTDAGVHAQGYVLHFDGLSLKIRLDDVVYKLNKMLPDDICAKKIQVVDSNFHARYSAMSRSYTYVLHLEKCPFSRYYSFQYPYNPKDIQLALLNSSVALLVGRHDFTAFSKTGSEVRHNRCTVTSANWSIVGHQYHFNITSNRFLRGMIRLIVGMSLNVSRGVLSHDEVRDGISEKCRLSHDWSVPAHGLILRNIIYPDEFQIEGVN